MALQLNIRVVEAKELAKMDTFGSSDPYCLLQISGSSQIQKTKVVKNSLTPSFNQEFQFPISDIRATLHILVKDEDAGSSDDAMAKLELALSSLPVGQVTDQWYPMRPAPGVNKGGDIHLVLHLAHHGDTPFVPKMQPQMQQNMYPQQPMMQPQMQPNMYPQQPMMQPQMQPMMQPQMQPNMYPQQPMMQPQMQPMMQPQMQPNMYPQQPMMQPGMQPMMQPGMQPMMQPGMQPMMPGMMPGMQQGLPPNFHMMTKKEQEKYLKKMNKALKGKK